MELLIRGCKALNIDLSAETALKFERYYEAVIDYNRSVNLTAITDRTEFIIKHFLDSLTAAQYIPENASLADIGSGAGFPAIPLKLVRQDVSVTMMDALGKRVSFLQGQIDALGLKNASALHIRAEDAAKGPLRESFDVVTARAVARLNTLAEYALPLVKPGGIFIAYKGGDCDEEQYTARALELLKGRIAQSVKLNLPFSGDGRTLVIIEKTAPTPLKYPRGGGKERKNPL